MTKTDAQRLLNAERMRAYRARLKAEKEQAAVGATATPIDPLAPGVSAGDGGLTVTVKTTEPGPPLSLKDRLFGKKGSAPVAVKKVGGGGGKSTKQQQGNTLISSTLPTIIASLIATYSSELLPADYRPCAPSKAECSAVLGPLFEIIGRRVDVVTQASEDATAIANAFLAAVAYGARAYVMYVQIRHTKEKEEKGNGSESQKSNAHQAPTGASGSPFNNYGAGAGARVDSAVFAGAPTSAGYASAANGDAYEHGAVVGSDDSAGGDSDADKVANLFKRDVQGRRALGLLPTAV